MRRLLPLLALLALLATLSPASAQAADRTLSVLGRGSVQRRPDTAQVTASLRRTAPTARAARDSVNKRTARVIAVALGLGVARADIQTSSITLSRSTIRPLRRGAPRRVRYHAATSVELRVTDITRLGPLLNAITAAGANGIDGPRFSFASPSAGAADAERAALADARARADSAAAQLGLGVIGVQSVNLDPGAVDTPQPASETQAGSAPAQQGRPAPTPVQAGTEEITAAVAVVYLLG